MVVKYIKQLPSDLKVKKAFLFGSRARGLRGAIDLRIEPHPIKEADFTNINPFAYEIKTPGIETNLTE